MAAVGEAFLVEALSSACQIKKHMNVEVDITTNELGRAYLKSVPNSPFTKIISLTETGGYLVDEVANRFTKMHSILSSRFDKTIFIDSDVFLLSPIHDVFDTLDHWDFLACHAPVRYGSLHESFTSTFTGSKKDFLTHERNLRYTVPEINGGFIAISKNRRARKAVNTWRKLYAAQYAYYCSRPAETPIHSDQASLRRAILMTKPNIYILPPEFNIRVIMPYFVGGQAEARVLHGRDPGLSNALKTINLSAAARIGSPDRGIILQ